MKQNAKQRAWSMNKALNYTKKMRMRLLFSMMAIFLITTTAMAFTGDATQKDILDVGGSEAMICMVLVANVDDASATEKEAKQIKHKIYILWESQVDDTKAFPARANRNIGTIPLKAGEYWHYLKLAADPKFLSSLSGDISKIFESSAEVVVTGMSDDLLNMIETGKGEKCYLVFEVCSTGKKFLGGNDCKPLKLDDVQGGFGDDFTGYTLTFKNQCGQLWSNYTGSITLQAADVVAADAAIIPLTSNAGYQLTDGTAAAETLTGLSGVADSDIGRVITIYGSGGAFPSIITDANDFILIDGAQWTGLVGTEISFQIFKNAAAGYTYIEVAGSRK